MLVAPQIPSIPAANFARTVPRRVSRAGRSASLSILSIDDVFFLLLIIPQTVISLNMDKHRIEVTNTHILSLIEQMQIIFLSFIQRPSLILLIDISQQHDSWMPTQYLLRTAAL